MRVVLLVTLALIWPCAAVAGQGQVPSQDSFSVLSEDATETSRVVAVRIDRRMSSADLARIANTIKDRKTNPVMRHTQVSFFLPSMPLDQRPWASVDTTPAPKVIIGGLRLEEAQAYATAATVDRRALVGSWLTELPASPGRISIFNDKGKTYLEWEMRSGSKSVDEVVATRGTRGSRFDLRGGGDDYYLLKASGELELRNKQRLIAIAEHIPLPKGAPLAVSTSAKPLAPQTAAAASMKPASATLPDNTAPVATAPAQKKRIVRREAPHRKASSAVVVSDYMRPQITQ